MKNHNELTISEREDLERKIDLEFENKILKPREERIIDFLTKIQNYEFEFRTSNDTKQLEVISLYYYANSPLSFLFVQPCYEFYENDKNSVRAEIHLEDYSFYDIENLCKNILTENDIDFSDIDEDEFEYDEFWDNKNTKEKQFIIDCWQKAKKITNSKLMGFLDASDYSGGTYYLDNGNSLWESRTEIREYLKSRGIEINTDERK